MPDGATYRDHLAAVEASGVDTGELDPLPIPPGGDELFTLFWQLRRSAGTNGMSPNAISFSEVKAWQDLAGVTLAPTEIDLLLAMDNAALVAFSEK